MFAVWYYATFQTVWCCSREVSELPTVARKENSNRERECRKISLFGFCYGSHEEYRLPEANLQAYDSNTSVNSSTLRSDVKKAYAKPLTVPETYQKLSNLFLGLKEKDKGKQQIMSTSTVKDLIAEQLEATQTDLEKTKKK
ncbi:hypothetical protein QYM36_005830 [Artemia franciscana]|uniref:Uncharacterized protein n=1 Tax=Artemia franciscana TaxID=6661 RepID=A0AA88LAU8_ARTSF|nr:hypothetical protein QYM36_005830 [Artemia franciscana]